MIRRNHGFTLIEMMVVVAIIGILAATAVPSYRIYINQARLLAAEVTIQQAIRDFSIDNDYSPAMIEDLVTGGYLTAIPNDPWTRVGSSAVASNDVLPSPVPSALAATASLGIEEAGDWFYNNDGQTVTFYAKTHPGRAYHFPSFGLPPLATPTPPSTGTPATPPSPQPPTPPSSQQGGSDNKNKGKGNASDNRKKDSKKKDKKSDRKKKNRRD
jgi:prepilin-type N-terminal cleavage/methylation domain-containing protein